MPLLNIKGMLIAAGIGAAAAGITAGVIVHKIDSATISDLKRADAEAYAAGVKAVAAKQKAQDDVALAAAVKAAQDFEREFGIHNVITQRIPVYVQDTSRCITYGLVRVLNAAAEGRDPAAVEVASGKPDDACAPVTWRAFAADITDDYATARLNAKQLDDLIQSVKDIHDAKPAAAAANAP